MGRKASTKKDYFNESEMLDKLAQYQQTKDPSLLEELVAGFQLIIDGMINSEFSYNTFVKDNREDASHECIYQLIRSMNRYDVSRGRLFAYSNRIIKNTLTHFSDKMKRRAYREITHTELSGTYSTDDGSCDQEVIASIIYNECSADQTAEVRDYEVCADESVKNVYAIFGSIKDRLNRILENKDELKKEIERYRFDPKVEFDIPRGRCSLINRTDEDQCLRYIKNAINKIDAVLSYMDNKYKPLKLDTSYRPTNGYRISGSLMREIVKYGAGVEDKAIKGLPSLLSYMIGAI